MSAGAQQDDAQAEAQAEQVAPEQEDADAAQE